MASRFGSMESLSLSSVADIEELKSSSTRANVQAVEDKVFVSVGEKFKENKSTLIWALQFFKIKRVVLVHVHCPEKYISIMGGKFSVTQASPEHIKAHRLLEQTNMHKKLDKYVHSCNEAKIQVEKLVIVMDDVAKGLLELVAQHHITRLVMGAAADKYYSTNMKVPKSKKATIVNNEAPSSCKIWFVCKGTLICTRDSIQDINVRGQSSSTRPNSSIKFSKSKSSLSKTRSESSRLTNPVQELIRSMLRSSRGNASMAPSPATRSSPGNPDPCNGITSPPECPSSSGGDGSSNLDLSFMSKYDDSQDGSVLEEPYSVHSDNQQVDFETDEEMYNRLRQMLEEARNSKCQAYEESCKRSAAEIAAMEARQRARNSEIKCAEKIKEGEELKESIAKLVMEVESLKTERNEAHEQHKIALQLKSHLETQLNSYGFSIKHLEEKLLLAQQLLCSIQGERDEARKELKNALLLKSQLEMQLNSQGSSIKDLEEKLSSVQQLLCSLQSERDALQQELDSVVNQRIKSSANGQLSGNVLEFSFSELEKATCGFEDSQKIGEGGYGSVYKGFLRHTTVAIKVLRPHNWQGISEFHQEVEILSKVRHPNLVTLIGACSEKKALVYEYLPNGCLEDHLQPGEHASPLSWQARIRIIAEVCSALIFLHSNRPQSVVHGDLKPANILLHANLTIKLSDFGISRLLTESATAHTLYCQTGPKGTLVYMDPEFLMTGELTTQSDVYSFGVVLLRLLTGKAPFGIVREVKDALAKGNLQGILDPRAGDWPFVQAQKLAELGLRCCEMSRKLRPQLESDVWSIIAPMMRPLLKEAPSFSIGPNAEDNSFVPAYFICPIFQEIMRDPHVASDGYTYEAEAIKGWLRNHKTSPTTNLQLPNDMLIPNVTLRSAIKEWSRQHEKS